MTSIDVVLDRAALRRGGMELVRRRRRWRLVVIVILVVAPILFTFVLPAVA